MAKPAAAREAVAAPAAVLTFFVLGGVWTLWHVPLFFSAGTAQSRLPMGLYALSAIAASVLFAWLFNRTAGSVLPVLVLHTAVLLLFFGGPTPQAGSVAPQVRP